MPAVQLSRLKADLTRLSTTLGSPERFRKGLVSLYELYADRTYRPGQVVMPASQTPSYHVQPLVAHQLRLELRPYCLSDPEKALAAFDTLIEETHQEPLVLAAFMLGQVSPIPLERVLPRLERLLLATGETGLRKTLLAEATTRLRCEQPAALLGTCERWLGGGSPEMQKAALALLLVLAGDRSFENLPPVYRLAGQVLQDPPAELQALLQETLTALAERSPQETLFFARQAAASPASPATIRLLRRLMPLFSPAGQASLRSALGTGQTENKTR